MTNETPETPPVRVVPSLFSLVASINAAIQHTVSKGDSAELRRLDPENPSCAAFWRLSAMYLQEQLPSHGEYRDEAERKWACIFQSMAQLGGLTQSNARLGQALLDAGYSELRFTKLLRSTGPKLRNAVREAARFLASKGKAANPFELAQLILSDNQSNQEKVRRDIARNYYKTQE
jgi:CRISPR system Cascade subunit CasB